MSTKTEIVDAAIIRVAQGGKDPSFNDYEQKLYLDLLRKIRHNECRPPELEGQLWRLEYAKKPPTINEFVLDDYFLGNTWRHIENENEGIWPEWLAILKANLDLESRVHNMVITGSLGIGKTVMMVTILLYRVCIACHLKNPQNFFGLNRNTNIVYNFLSITKQAVKETGYGDAMSFMANSPWFKEVCGYDPDSDYSGFRIPMKNLLPNGAPSRIWITAGSKGQHVLGRNLLGIGLDEGNFRLEKDPDMKAYDLYDEVRTRISNRFQKIASYLPAISIIASSAQDESSFTEKIVGEIDEHNRKREEDNKKILNKEEEIPLTQSVFRNAVYRIKRHALPGIGPDHHWFRVAYGLKNMEPYILSGWYKEDGVPVLEEPHEDAPSGARTELVPKFYYETYKRNPKAGLQNLSGISVGGAHRLFPSLIDIETCLSLSAEEKVPNPMLPGVQRIPLSSEDTHNIWDSLNHRAFLTRVASRIQPIRHPQNLRYAHIDLATQTLAGVAICHLASTQLVEGLVKDSQPYSEYRLVVEYDFILTICAGQTKPINIEKIQKFFFWLRDMCGYRFGMVTADMWQCLSGHVLLHTQRGLLPVSEVKIGDTVQTQTSLKPVTALHRYPNATILRLVTNHGEQLEGTPNHRIRAAPATNRPFVKAKFRWMRLDELKAGDIVDMRVEPVSANLVTAPYSPQSKAPHLIRFNRAFAEWLGMYWGDGCASLQNGIRITCHENEAMFVQRMTEQAIRLRVKVYRKKKSKSQTIACFSRKLVRWMEQEKLLKPESLSIPEAVLRSKRHLIAAFLRGLFSADGHVDKLGSITLTTKSNILARQVSLLLRTEFELRSHILKRVRKLTNKRFVQYVVQVGGSRKIFHDQIGFLYTSKQHRLAQHLGKQGRRLLHRVKSIEKVENGTVFDITVADEKNYVANGFCSHNSEAPLQSMEARGFKVAKLSIDRDKSVYLTWRTGFEEQRVRLYRNEQMFREAEQLLEMDKKYDHPPDGSKDTTDACSGAYFNAVNSDEKLSLISQNLPSMYTGHNFTPDPKTQVPMTIPLPEKGYTRSKVFEA